ncbi:hypothetical protein ACFL51_01305 [Myxococcota bacterium]
MSEITCPTCKQVYNLDQWRRGITLAWSYGIPRITIDSRISPPAVFTLEIIGADDAPATECVQNKDVHLVNDQFDLIRLHDVLMDHARL